MADEGYLKGRALSSDLKQRMVELIESHPASANSVAVFAALMELTLTLAHSQFGANARTMWVRAFDENMPRM